ncbi:MAG: hypothetical protein RPU35_14630, partial [Candidatus Sedimenticola sp. (ex Thyasira tokunagai)]
SSNELAMLLRSAGDRDGRGNNRLSKIECKRGTRMSRFASRNRRLAYRARREGIICRVASLEKGAPFPA